SAIASAGAAALAGVGSGVPAPAEVAGLGGGGHGGGVADAGAGSGGDAVRRSGHRGGSAGGVDEAGRAGRRTGNGGGFWLADVGGPAMKLTVSPRLGGGGGSVPPSEKVSSEPTPSTKPGVLGCRRGRVGAAELFCPGSEPLWPVDRTRSGREGRAGPLRTRGGRASPRRGGPSAGRAG